MTQLTSFTVFGGNPDTSNCIIAGYGENNDGGAGVLNAANVSISKVSNTALASDGEGYAGHGDSGGALLCSKMGKKALVGVMSRTSGMNETIITNLVPFEGWIRSIINN